MIRLISEIDSHSVWTGNSREITDYDGIPPNWILRQAPTDPQADKFYRVLGAGWEQLDEHPNPPFVAREVILMPVSAWFLRLSNDEVRIFGLLETEVNALSPADYSDPNKQEVVYWKIFLTHFQRLTNDVDLNHPQVLTGMAFFQALAYGRGLVISDERLDDIMRPPR